MLKSKLYITLILLMQLSSNYANDIYSKFHQKDYKLDFQRLELMNYSKKIFNFFQVKTFKYNRTLPVINSTFNTKVTFGPELEVAVQFYKFLSNEYRQLRGSKFQVNYCKSLNEDLVGLQSLFKCGNYTSCHLVKGITYKVCNMYPDESRFPPFIPTGEYKFQVDAILNTEIILTLASYVKIYRPIARSQKKV